MESYWLLFKNLSGDFVPRAIFSDIEKMEAFLEGQKGQVDGDTWDCEEIDLDPPPESGAW